MHAHNGFDAASLRGGNRIAPQSPISGTQGSDGCKSSAGNSGAGLLLSRGDQGANQQREGQRERRIQAAPQAFDQPDHCSSSFAAWFPVATGAWPRVIARSQTEPCTFRLFSASSAARLAEL